MGISRDHSGSMYGIARAAARDYNDLISSIKTNAAQENVDTIVNVVKCGIGNRGANVMDVTNSSASALQPLNENQYETSGGSTPLFDSIGMLIDQLESSPDANNPDVNFLVMSITDGGDNSSRNTRQVIDRIRRLQNTDRWTFVFRVPRGYARELERFGVHAGNILEWDQTQRGVQEASVKTSAAMETFYKGKAAGTQATKSFYSTDMTGVTASQVKKALIDISADVLVWDVAVAEDGQAIRLFCESRLNHAMKRGAAFYQLMKKEDEVQDYKQIVIRDKKSKVVYSGANARQMLGLPYNGTVKVVPGNHGTYDIFIQSTSVNRKLVKGTQVLYWDKVGQDYSAPTTLAAAPTVQPAPAAPVAVPKTTLLNAVKPATPAPQTSTTGHSAQFIEGYKVGFVDGKNKSQLNIGLTGQMGVGYQAGYKDGRGKKKRLYK